MLQEYIEYWLDGYARCAGHWIINALWGVAIVAAVFIFAVLIVRRFRKT